MGQEEIIENQILVEKLSGKQEIDKEQLKHKFVSLFHYHNELTASLKYADVIQRGVLPKTRHFKRMVSDHFVMYHPQTFVSGDFYWIGEVKGKVLFAVGDCTGHGVPGAMLTMLAQSFLNYIILGKKNTDTSSILKEFDKKFIETFQSEGNTIYSNDWIDIALCCYDKESMTVEFAGAKRKILHVSQNAAELLKGSNYPLGGWQIENLRDFEHKALRVEKGDIIFLGTDGFQDQIGGDYQKKFGSKRLHELMIEIATLPCSKQKMILEQTFLKWKLNQEQMDDVCLMGIRI